MKVVIDTCAYLDIRKGEKLQEIEKVLQEAEEIIVTTILLGEIYHGAYLQKESTQEIILLEKFMGKKEVVIKTLTPKTSLIFGEICVSLGKEKRLNWSQNDIWMGAICKENNYYCLTSDKKMKKIKGMKVINY